MRQTRKLTDIHEKAVTDFNEIQEIARGERDQALEDRRFCTIPGAQWEGNLGIQYENRPKFEVNKTHLSVFKIINQYRNNRIDVDFVPRTKGTDKLAELCDGMYRADSKDSEGEEAHDNAFEEGVTGGMGAFRLRACYEDEYDEENEQQRIKIEPIYDADVSCYWDLDAKRFDKSDAKYCYVISSITRGAYEEEYEDDPTTWPKELYNNAHFDWYTPDIVYIAEYYKCEETSETKVYYKTIVGDEETYWLNKLDDEEIKEMKDMGHKEVRRRKVKTKRIHKYIMSGGKVLEDCGYIAGKEIPIVPVYGKRWFVENVERFMGHVRLAKDAQRLKNMQLSKLGEISALSTVEKPILTPEQIAGHANMWKDDNIKDYPYLLINPLTNEEGQTVAQGPIGYTKPSNVPPALATLLQITEEDMKDVLGHYEKGEELESHISGRAVELVQERLDMQAYIYISNFAKSLKRSGEIWLSMAKDIYIEDEREVKVIDRDGQTSSKILSISVADQEGNIGIENDLDDANFDVDVEIGPSSNTQRDSVIRQTQGMLQYTQDPETQQVLTSMAMMNMEGEGTSDLREYFRKKLVKMGAVTPTDKDIEEMELNPDQPSPNDQYLMAEAKRAESEAQKMQAETQETMSNSKLKEAQAMQIMQELQTPVQENVQEPKEPTFKEEEIITKAFVEKAKLDLQERELELREREIELRYSQDIKDKDIVKDGSDVK
jgi:hypothetical protein